MDIHLVELAVKKWAESLALDLPEGSVFLAGSDEGALGGELVRVLVACDEADLAAEGLKGVYDVPGRIELWRRFDGDDGEWVAQWMDWGRVVVGELYESGLETVWSGDGLKVFEVRVGSQESRKEDEWQVLVVQFNCICCRVS